LAEEVLDKGRRVGRNKRWYTKPPQCKYNHVKTFERESICQLKPRDLYNCRHNNKFFGYWIVWVTYIIFQGPQPASIEVAP
jgi:hypothetical protein